MVSNTSQASQSKSYVNAMKALQDKCRRVESEKQQITEQYQKAEETNRKSTQILEASINRLQKELEQKAL